MDSRSLDRRIRVEREEASASFGAAGKKTWVLVAEPWAQVRDVLPSRDERVTQGLQIATRRARIRMRYRTDITAAMRIVIGARVMQIIGGPATLGRREATEILAEDYSAGGA